MKKKIVHKCAASLSYALEQILKWGLMISAERERANERTVIVTNWPIRGEDGEPSPAPSHYLM